MVTFLRVGNKFHQTTQWKRKHESTLITPKVVASVGKRIATVFWDKRENILIDWLPNKLTINTEYYVQVLRDLREGINNKRRGKLRTACNSQYLGVILHQDRP